ncbi:F-type H+-transporting ATPase subunit gamma [Catalinimonas alkaloidigena]|uniref:ATP synthase F1 subunit gamma n=1 Tax=Catalinimonas alkaloidigena TaxID=1075417 RepID=UPI0024049622|nr:ATP synthase F1 subunit gamma [Catalinimonas alkaloidigena]MDF9798310.1 F-type H+-transporting ATPase subunit gamma [Catalinimonas alkaloidigena]
MPSLKAVKSRIASVKSTQQITKAMKMVAASKLRKAQDRLLQMRPYAEKLTKILNNVSSNLSEENVSEYAISREVKNVVFVVFTSDKGLCGAFNTSLFRYLRQLISNEYSTYERNNRLKIMTVGTKGRDYYKRRGQEMIDEYADLFSEQTFENVRNAAEAVMEMYRKKEVDKVVLVYNTFKNVATQIVTNEQFLPVQSSTEEKEENANDNGIDYIYEPSEEYIVEELIPQSLKIQFYKAYLESAASEQGARMTAMDQATDNAGELLKQLKLTYNRTRQAAITKEILEIVAGADALES